MQVVDMVLHEVTRNATATSEQIALWVDRHTLPILATRAYQHYRCARTAGETRPNKANLGEIAIQEAMHELALTSPAATGVFLFEDHKIARTSFLLPDQCRKVSTRAWLLFLEGQGWIDSAAEIERAAIARGRNFSKLRFPP